MKMQMIVRVCAVVSSVSVASGVIWWGVKQANGQRQVAEGAATVAAGTQGAGQGPADQNPQAILLSGSKSRMVVDVPPATTPEQTMLMQSSKSGRVVSPLPTTAPQPATAPTSAPAGAPSETMRPLTPEERTVLMQALKEQEARKTMLMSSSKSIVITDSSAKIEQLRQILESGTLMVPVSQAATSPATSPATGPATAPGVAPQSILMMGSKSAGGSLVPAPTSKPATAPSTAPATKPDVSDGKGTKGKP